MDAGPIPAGGSKTKGKQFLIWYRDKQANKLKICEKADVAQW